jgi:cytochrome d ubiquinol oxidase subunit I
MQALSFVAHIPLVCFAIAFPAMVLFTEWCWLRTGDAVYLTLARRWTRILVALFAVGVVTGTILSFELGFAIEGFSFFLEAIFIGIFVYGWNRLSPRTHFLTGIPIAIAGLTGSLTVISVNGWMNHPTGFHLQNGKPVDVRPWHALFVNSYFWHELVHMYVAGYMVTGFMLASVYALARLRGRWTRYERTAFAIPLAVAALASPVQILVGDWAGRSVAHSQPLKLAAFEGLGHTTKGAPLHILGWYSNGDIKFAIEIPKLLSLLAYHHPNATVKGLDTVPAGQRPPVNVVRVAFQIMVGIGTLLALLGVVYLWVRIRWKRLPHSRWFYLGVVAAGPLSVVALIAGWVVTEVGRQPWVVYRLLRTSEAISHSGGIPIGYVTLALIYLGLALAVAWILRRLSRRPLEV